MPDGGRPPPTAVFYVAGESGNDAADGKTPLTAMRTIGNALGQGIDGAEIRVCRGIYQERNLVVNRNTVLRGGYNCATWARGPGFGTKGGFSDPNNDTILEADPANAISSTLQIDGKAVTDALIEGFTVNGAAPSALEGSALRVASMASASIEDCVVRGGSGRRSEPGPATVGIIVAAGTKVAIRRSRIDGGAGESSDANVGSTGVLLSGEGVLEDSKVSAGSGTGGSGNQGVLVSSASGPVQIARNEIVMSAAEVNAPTTQLASAGIWVTGSNASPVAVLNNRVYGTSQACTGRCVTYGIYVRDADSARIEGNWVYTGKITGMDDLPRNTCALALAGVVAGRVRNNVLAAERTSTESGAPFGLQTLGSGGDILHNTVLVLTGGKNTSGNLGLYILGSRGQRIQNNAFYVLGTGTPLAVSGCALNGIAATPLSAFSNNAVAAEGPTRALWWADTSGVCTVSSAGTVSDTALAGHYGANPTGNVDVPVTTLAPSAEAALAAAVTQRTLRVAADPSMVCPIARKGADIRTDVANDILGKLRGPSPTIGALESDVPICP
jgi:hypothetical protein